MPPTLAATLEDRPLPPTAVPTPAPPTRTVDPATQYIGQGTAGWGAGGTLAQALPTYIDDVTRDFGADLYARMLTDPQVASAIQLPLMHALAEPVTLGPAVPPDAPDGDQAAALVAFAARNLAGLPRPIESLLFEVGRGLAFGHTLGEITVRPTPTEWLLDEVRVLPPTSYRFVLDAGGRWVGVQPQTPGAAWGWGRVTPDTPVLPRAKFVHFCWQPHYGDPRGTSQLRPVYHAWWMKQQTYPEYLAYLATFARPSVKGICAPDAQDVPQTAADATILPALTPPQALSTELEKVRNGGVIALPHGADVQLLQAYGAGEPFLAAIKLFDAQITKGVQGQTLATDESQYQPKASSSVHQDNLDLLVRYIKITFIHLVREQLLRPLVALNFGADVAARLTPTVSIGFIEHQDFAAYAAVVAQLAQSYLHPSQYPALDARMGLPPRDLGPVGEGSGPSPTTEPAQPVRPAAQPVPAGGAP